jgi:hypothetical protein
MAFVHGKSVFVSVDGDELSAYSNSVELKREGDSHDVTCFGQTAHKYKKGLTDGTFTLKGTYDDGAAGPAAILMPLVDGDEVEVVYRPEGTGTGKPHYTFDALVTSYEESSPVADMITWSAELQVSDAVPIGTQA